MSKLSPAKLTLEDFKEQREWIGPLFQVLNGFTAQLVASFDNQVTVSENLFQEIKEIKWKNASSDYPLKFRSKFKAAPQIIMPGYLYDNTLATVSPLIPYVVWGYSDGVVSISNISGLTASSTYTIRLLVIYG